MLKCSIFLPFSLEIKTESNTCLGEKSRKQPPQTKVEQAHWLNRLRDTPRPRTKTFIRRSSKRTRKMTKNNLSQGSAFWLMISNSNL